jgi:hypothetical protein
MRKFKLSLFLAKNYSRTFCLLRRHLTFEGEDNYVRRVNHRPLFKCLTFVRGPYEKFVNSPYYSELELCGEAVTVSFSKYLPWQTMHFLQRSNHFSKKYCRPFAASFRRIAEQTVSCLGAPFWRLEKPRNRLGRDLDCTRVYPKVSGLSHNEVHYNNNNKNNNKHSLRSNTKGYGGKTH